MSCNISSCLLTFMIDVIDRYIDKYITREISSLIIISYTRSYDLNGRIEDALLFPPFFFFWFKIAPQTFVDNCESMF